MELALETAGNERSMLYIGNVVKLVRLLIESVGERIFLPQNG